MFVTKTTPITETHSKQHAEFFNVKPKGTYRNFRDFKCLYKVSREHEVEHLLQALRYKKEGRGFDCRWCP